MTEDSGFAVSSDPDKDPSKPVKFDHGEPDDALQARQEAEAADQEDPQRDIPVQMRPENQDPSVVEGDGTVEPAANEGAGEGSAPAES